MAEIRMYMPDRQSRMKAQVREFFLRAKDLLLPEMLMPATRPIAYSSGAGNPTARQRPMDNVSLFDTGPAPKSGTPSRNIMDWKASITVLEAGDARDPDKLQIDFTEAQRAVSDILENPRAVHPYITSEAARMFNDEPLVRKHLWHLVVGALAEDYTFMPGESLTGICNNETKVPQAFKEVLKPGSSAGSPFFRGLLLLVTKIWNRLKSDPYGDAADRPYWAHFYKRTGVLEGHGLSILNDELKFQSARDRLMKYWNLAADYYAKGDTSRAFYSLGHAVHLVQDLHVPAHVHNDPHGPTFLLGNLDSFETWTAKGDWPSITRGRGDANVTIWDSRSLTRPAADTTWNKGNIDVKLASLCGTIAYKTQQLRSVDVEGVGVVLRGQAQTGALSDAECYEQARILIPSAILDSAKLIVNFVDYVKRDGKPML